MEYIVCTEPGLLELKEKEETRRNPEEVLIAIRKVGICGTDLHAFRGRQPFFSYPRILGHELAAEVLEVDGGEKTLSSGDKVVPIPYVFCGTCVACRAGRTNCCQQLKVLGVHIDGGMQQMFSLPAHLLIPTPQLTYAQMAIVEPLSIGAHAVRRSGLTAGEKVVVVGCGPIGLGLMKFALLEGAEVIALDNNADRLRVASEVIGVSHTVNVQDQPLEAVKELTGGDLASCVFDATGNQLAMEAGPDYVGHGGSYVLVGLFNGPLSFMHPALHAREMSILCSRNATRSDLEHVIDVLSRDLFPVESYITHDVDFHTMIDHFEGWTDPANQVIKATVNWN